VLTADGKRAVSASADKTLKVWDPEGGRELRTLEGHTDGVNAVALTADSKRAVSASADRTVAVWDIETGELIASFGADSAVRTCAVASDGLTFVACRSTGIRSFPTA
jgi:WD40 repeat protein